MGKNKSSVACVFPWAGARRQNGNTTSKWKHTHSQTPCHERAGHKMNVYDSELQSYNMETFR